jgi:hypothetical protein
MTPGEFTLVYLTIKLPSAAENLNFSVEKKVKI